jgi:hypothetical protein
MKNFLSKLLQGSGLLLFVAALAAVGALVISDVTHGLRLTALHGHLGAVALILIGGSYVSLQIVSRRSRHDLAKGILLGSAFILWGSEQLLSPSRWITAMDTAVVAIFVVDLGLVIVRQLKRPLP